MFNWVQHLFTARALQRENAELLAKINQLEAEIDENKKVVAVKDEEIQRLKNRIESQKTPPYDYSKSAASGQRII